MNFGICLPSLGATQPQEMRKRVDEIELELEVLLDLASLTNP